MKRWKNLRLLYRRIILCVAFLLIGVGFAQISNSGPRVEADVYDVQVQELQKANDKLNEINSMFTYIEDNKNNYNDFIKQTTQINN